MYRSKEHFPSTVSDALAMSGTARSVRALLAIAAHFESQMGLTFLNGTGRIDLAQCRAAHRMY
jgi:hypothetical protein